MENQQMKRRRKTRRKVRIHRRFNRFLKLLLGLWLKLSFNLRAENRSALRNLEPPYLVMPNHVCFWDPFMVSIFLPHPVYWVTSDANFRSPILNFLLGLVGSIPKTKVVSDFDTIRHILNVRSMKGVIGVFPEGRRTWDGTSLSLIYSTAKLVRTLKLPIVVPRIKGAFLSNPRWSRQIRRGRLTVDFGTVVQPEAFAGRSVEEIYRELSKLLQYDEWQEQQRAMTAHPHPRRAERLELVLHTCPRCRAIGGLRSARTTFRCDACGYEVQYSEYGFFEGTAQPLFRTVADWNKWQIDRLRERIDGIEPGGTVFRDCPVHLSIGYRSEPLAAIGYGTLTLFGDRIEFRARHPRRAVQRIFSVLDSAVMDADGLRVDFPAGELYGQNVQDKERFEWYCRNLLFRFRDRDRSVSGLKWIQGLNLLQARDRAASGSPVIVQ